MGIEDGGGIGDWAGELRVGGKLGLRGSWDGGGGIFGHWEWAVGGLGLAHLGFVFGFIGISPGLDFFFRYSAANGLSSSASDSVTCRG